LKCASRGTVELFNNDSADCEHTLPAFLEESVAYDAKSAIVALFNGHCKTQQRLSDFHSGRSVREEYFRELLRASLPIETLPQE